MTEKKKRVSGYRRPNGQPPDGDHICLLPKSSPFLGASR